MGTRGLIGFRFREKDFLSYNHFDSNPYSLGVRTAEFLMEFLKSKSPDDLRESVFDLLPVKEDPPSPLLPLLRAKLKRASIKVVKHAKAELGHRGEPSLAGKVNWYSTLRECQGDFEKILASGIILDAKDFILDSLFCEWGYILNLDDGLIEIYRGFIKRDDPCHGRYSHFMPPPFEVVVRPNGRKDQIPNDYRACSLLQTFPVTPKGAKDFFLSCGGNEGEGGIRVLLKGKGGERQRGLFKPLPALLWNETTGEPFRDEGFTFTHAGKHLETTKYGYVKEAEAEPVKAAE